MWAAGGMCSWTTGGLCASGRWVRLVWYGLVWLEECLSVGLRTMGSDGSGIGLGVASEMDSALDWTIRG